MLTNHPLTTEGALKWISSKFPSNTVLNAGSTKRRRYGLRTKIEMTCVGQTVEAFVCLLTAGSEDDWPLGSAHKCLDGS